MEKRIVRYTIKNEDGSCRYDGHLIDEAMDRLCAYENTNMLPDEIMMNSKWNELSNFNESLRRLLSEFAESWKKFIVSDGFNELKNTLIRIKNDDRNPKKLYAIRDVDTHETYRSSRGGAYSEIEAMEKKKRKLELAHPDRTFEVIVYELQEK